MPSSLKKLKDKMHAAQTYEAWKEAATAYDKQSGAAQWRRVEKSNLYDYVSIRDRYEQLKALRKKSDAQGLLFALNEGIHGNIGGMGSSKLYSKTQFGTKQLIVDYVETINKSLKYLADDRVSSIGLEDKLDFFRRADHCFGRTAIMFSGGGNLVYFHVGVAKALLEQKLLPTVISGASAGAMIAAIIGTHTEAQLKQLFKPEKINFGSPWEPNTLEKVTGIRRVFSIADIEASFERLIPNLTFAEAFELTGRHINISISPVERHQTSRLLNATTSPNVLIRSAVRASTALPGIVGPVTLTTKNAAGKEVPYLPSRSWLDGSFADDLPAKRLSRLYGVNHYIVSMINPYALNYIKTPKLLKSITAPFKTAGKEVLRSQLKLADQALSNSRLNAPLAGLTRLMHDTLSQNYSADINIVLNARYASPFKIISPYTIEEVADLIDQGARSTWPVIEQIRISSMISRTLEQILHKFELKEHKLLSAGSTLKSSPSLKLVKSQ